MVKSQNLGGIGYSPQSDRLITKREASDILGISVRSLEREISAGKLPVVRIRASVRLLLSVVLRHAGIECVVTLQTS